MKILLVCLLLAAASCGNRPLQPADIDPTDMCAQCKMAISEKRYAAELLEPDGAAVKFDNIDCMIRYASARGLKDRAAAWYVMDSEGREWLDARRALLVRSASLPGPMGAGTLAVKDPAKAQQLAQRFSGTVVRFDALWK